MLFKLVSNTKFLDMEACWYLSISSQSDLDQAHTLFAQHFFFDSFHYDPHVDLRAHPVERASRWVVAACKLLLEKGEILINSKGGFMYQMPEHAILKTMESNRWPKDEMANLPTITVSRWETHWYLSCESIPFKDKFASSDGAINMALQYTTMSKVVMKDMPAGLTPER